MIDDDRLLRLSLRLGRRLLQNGMSVATAESCTGGFIAKVLTDVPGSSEWFFQGAVTYSNQAKIRLLGVESGVLKRHGAVSEQVARQMATGAASRYRCDVAVAVTGIAGPGGGVPGKPVGTVWLAWALRGKGKLRVTVMRKRFRGNRDDVRRKTVDCALQGLLRLLA